MTVVAALQLQASNLELTAYQSAVPPNDKKGGCDNSGLRAVKQ